METMDTGPPSRTAEEENAVLVETLLRDLVRLTRSVIPTLEAEIPTLQAEIERLKTQLKQREADLARAMESKAEVLAKMKLA